MKVEPWPDGTKIRIASGFASAARCRNGEKSGLCSGMRMFSTWPPAALKVSEKEDSTSWPGPKSDTIVTTLFMPCCATQVPKGAAICGTTCEVRTMKGERSVMTEVAAAMTTIGVLACVASGAVASASGVRPKPASAVTLSLTISSCAIRRVTSATPVSSLRITSTLRPATVAPFCWT